MVAKDTLLSPIAKKSYLESKPRPTLEFNLKNWVSCTVTKSSPTESTIGLDFEYNTKDGNIYITNVFNYAKMFSDARVGDKLHKFFGNDAIEYSKKGQDGITELYQIMKNETVISFETLHNEYDNKVVDEIPTNVEIGDIIPLQDYSAKSELNGQDVEVLRGLKNNKFLVKLISNPKEKIVVHSSNLYYEILKDKLIGKDEVEGDVVAVAVAGNEKTDVDVPDDEQDQDDADDVAEALEAVKFEEDELERQRQKEDEQFNKYKDGMQTRMGC